MVNSCFILQQNHWAEGFDAKSQLADNSYKMSSHVLKKKQPKTNFRMLSATNLLSTLWVKYHLFKMTKMCLSGVMFLGGVDEFKGRQLCQNCFERVYSDRRKFAPSGEQFLSF